MFKDSKAFSGFSVDDITRAEDFYHNLLGVAITKQEEGLVLNIAGGTDIFIYAKPDHQPATFTILNFAVDSVDSAVDDMTAMGIEFLHYDEEGIKTDEKGIHRSGGPVIAWFKDPAGNILSVLEIKE